MSFKKKFYLLFREWDRKSLEGEQLYKKFKVRKLQEESIKDPVMQLLLKKVCQMGRNIELLVTLDRLSDMWDTMNDQDGKILQL